MHTAPHPFSSVSQKTFHGISLMDVNGSSTKKVKYALSSADVLSETWMEDPKSLGVALRS
jgi:hypothetical protein